jgi:hypothetical protein
MRLAPLAGGAAPSLPSASGELIMDLTQGIPSKAAKNAPLIPQAEVTGSTDVRSVVRTEARPDRRNAVRKDAAAQTQSAGYGLPCANCHLYYAAGLDACPTCDSSERVSPVALLAVRSAPPPALPVPDAATLEREREAFLKQLKSQLATAETKASAPAICTTGEHRNQAGEPATVCKHCYDRLQERVDVFEAALHIDLKEAAQIVYDAVWADPSDPSKTYTNAASALLTELRKRSGVSSLLGPFQPLDN